jgi:hypothetical protein
LIAAIPTGQSKCSATAEQRDDSLLISHVS